MKPMIIPMYLNRNGQAITLTKALFDSSSRWRSRNRIRISCAIDR